VLQFGFLLVAAYCLWRGVMKLRRAARLLSQGKDKLAAITRRGGIAMIVVGAGFVIFALVVMPLAIS
jgi:hypothetical protein